MQYEKKPRTLERTLIGGRSLSTEKAEAVASGYFQTPQYHPFRFLSSVKRGPPSIPEVSQVTVRYGGNQNRRQPLYGKDVSLIFRTRNSTKEFMKAEIHHYCAEEPLSARLTRQVRNPKRPETKTKRRKRRRQKSGRWILERQKKKMVEGKSPTGVAPPLEYTRWVRRSRICRSGPPHSPGVRARA